MKWLKKTLFFSGFFLISLSLNAQLSITGTVTDAKTGQTLPGVNVYLANTTIGASTNGQGAYQISNIPSGIYVLVFSFVGYKTRTFQVKNKNASSSRTIDMSLQPRIFEMDEANVTSSNKEWKENFERFRKAFIGQTTFAENTTIENPWILNFSNDDETNSLIATARQPLTIINKALGYKLYIELVEFKWSRYKDTGIYKIYPRYEPLKAKTNKQAQRWRRNRVKAYLGSFPHFLKSLYTNKLKQNNFSLTQRKNIVSVSSSEVKYELLQRGHIQLEIAGFKIDHPVRIAFDHTHSMHAPSGSVKIKVKKVGAIESNTNNGIFLVHNTAKLLDPASLILFGDWARTRVADSLPDNYEIRD